MSAVGRIMNRLLMHYEGALVGALVGDCLGAPFEFSFDSADEKRFKKISKFFMKLDAGKIDKKCQYTDDTAMLRSVAASLASCGKLDARDLCQRFAEEFFVDPSRGYGSSIPVVFHQLRDTQYTDPFGPAAAQFNGLGSYGNGGAMRIAPAALFGQHFKEQQFDELVQNITRVTHTHRDAINGAILEANAVQLALKSNQSESPLGDDQILAELLKKMQHLESTGDKTEEKPYCKKLQKIKEFLEELPHPKFNDVEKELGNDVSALQSVPAAIFSFLRTIKGQPDQWENHMHNAFQRTIIYAISLGGDTDTIASMAGAVAGAYYGINSIPKEWQDACEGLQDAKTMAAELYKLGGKPLETDRETTD